MKKSMKMLMVLFLIVVLSLVLTGCGKKEETKNNESQEQTGITESKNSSSTGKTGDTIVATKTTEDETMGNYKEEILVDFKDNKVNSITMSMEFEKEEVAQLMYGLLGDTSGEGENILSDKVKLEGKKIIISMTAEEFAETEDEMTKEEIKKSLEEDGYTIK